MAFRLLARIALTASLATLSLSTGRALAQDSVKVAVPDSAAAAAPADTAAPAAAATPAADSLPVTVARQDSVPPIPLRPPVGPGGALWRSLLIPGWGQAKLGRGIAAGIFLAVEGVSLGMVLKTNSELQYAKATDSTAVDQKTQEREDWLVIMAVNHLLAGLEAYVSAHLWDFPGDLALKPSRGGVAASVSFPFRVP